MFSWGNDEPFEDKKKERLLCNDADVVALTQALNMLGMLAPEAIGWAIDNARVVLDWWTGEDRTETLTVESYLLTPLNNGYALESETREYDPVDWEEKVLFFKFVRKLTVQNRPVEIVIEGPEPYYGQHPVGDLQPEVRPYAHELRMNYLKKERERKEDRVKALERSIEEQKRLIEEVESQDEPEADLSEWLEDDG